MTQRSQKQNSSMHVYCDLVAKDLNKKKLDMQTVLKEGTRVPWTKELVTEYAEQIANIFNDAGSDVFLTLEEGQKVKWTMQRVKDHIWRPVQRKMYRKESTTELDTCLPSDIHMVVDKRLNEKFGVSFDWPSLDNQRKER